MIQASFHSSFAHQLKSLRNRKNLKQKDISEALGVSQSTIANYEQGIRFPDEKMLKSLSLFLGVSSDELLGLPGSFRRPADGSAVKSEKLEKEYRRLILAGKFGPALAKLIEGVQGGVPAREIFGRVLRPLLVYIGSRWEHGEISAVREHLYTEEIRRHTGIITHYTRKNPSNGFRCAAAAVGGEMHTLGLRMVSSILEIEGFEIFYLGTNAPAAELVRLCLEESIDLLALSVTMDYHINALASLVEAVRSEPSLRRMKIITGGSALDRSPDIWRDAGADGYAPDIDSVIGNVEGLLGTEKRGGPAPVSVPINPRR